MFLLLLWRVETVVVAATTAALFHLPLSQDVLPYLLLIVTVLLQMDNLSRRRSDR